MWQYHSGALPCLTHTFLNIPYIAPAHRFDYNDLYPN